MSNSVKLAPRMDYDGNAQAEFDSATQETITRYSAVVLDEDFIGPGHTTIPANGAPATGYPWVKRTSGSGAPTVAIVANAAGGLVALTLAATSEAEEADLYQNDMLNWDMTKYASFETRLAMAVLPATSAECVWGLRSAWVSGGPDNAARYLDFQISGNGSVNVRIKDGVLSPQSYATGVTLVAGVFHNFRIDIGNPGGVLFFIDGVRVSPAPPSAGMMFTASGANAILQPYFSCYKASGTDVPSMQVDSIQVSMNRA